MSSTIVGKILLNRYRVESFIASGGMSSVFRVWDIERNVPLAMKVLHGELAEDPSVYKRFEREARALKKLAHPNIVRFYGLNQADDLTFILEQYINGPTLKDVLRRLQGQPLSVKETLVYLKSLCASLGYAHTSGVVHCDIKPGNIMIDPGGTVYLTDFGVARHAESTTTTLASAGTPAYMAPEQIRAERVTSKTDVYALGIVLFEMLTGQRPFRGTEAASETMGSTTADRLRYAHLKLDPPDPRAICPQIPAELAGVVLRALEKDPEKRFASAQGLYTAACAAAGVAPEGVPDRVSRPPVDDATLSQFSPPVYSASTAAGAAGTVAAPIAAGVTGQPARRRSGWVWILIGAAVALVACLAIAFSLARNMAGSLPGPVGTAMAGVAIGGPQPTATPTPVTPTIPPPTMTLPPTYTPYPTFTELPSPTVPQPTYTPYSTYTPFPTYTVQPSDTPAGPQEPTVNPNEVKFTSISITPTNLKCGRDKMVIKVKVSDPSQVYQIIVFYRVEDATTKKISEPFNLDILSLKPDGYYSQTRDVCQLPHPPETSKGYMKFQLMLITKDQKRINDFSQRIYADF